MLPRSRLDALADAGLYAISLQADAGVVARAVEILAGGCVATTFVWQQHHGAVRAAAAAPAALRDEWLAPLARGERRAGVAFSHLRRPGAPMLRARRVDGGWALHGTAPWVTGWGRIDVVHVAARDEAGDIVWALMDAETSPTLSARRLEPVAVASASTVVLGFDGHEVPDARVTSVDRYEDWVARDAAGPGLRVNGSLALGVAGRCLRLLGPGPLDAALDEVRAALDAAGPGEEIAAARARASRFALHAAATLVSAGGGGAILHGEDAERLRPPGALPARVRPDAADPGRAARRAARSRAGVGVAVRGTRRRCVASRRPTPGSGASGPRRWATASSSSACGPWGPSVSPSAWGEDHELPEEAEGVHAAPWLPAAHGDDYGFVLDGRDPLPDPASRWQPDGVRGPAEVVDPTAFAWTDGASPGVPLAGLVIYELHVGTFTPEGTFDARDPAPRPLARAGHHRDRADARRRLPRHARTGATTASTLRARSPPTAARRAAAPRRRRARPRPRGDPRRGLQPPRARRELPRGLRRPISPRDGRPGGGAQLRRRATATPVRGWCCRAAMWVRDFHVDGLRLDAIARHLRHVGQARCCG